MNMFLHELRTYRKSTIIWTCSIVLFAIFMLSIFPTYSNNALELKNLLEGYPEKIRMAMGISIDNISTILGFYSFIFGYILLCGAIQAMNIGTSIISKETREKTADFLLTKPVSRTQIMTAKLLAVLTSLILTNCIYLIAVSIMASIVSKESYNFKIFFMISISMFFVQLIFMSLGISICVIVAKIKSVISVSLGTVFTFFIIGMLNSAANDEKLRYLSPFNYFNTTYIIENSSYEASFVIVSIVFVIVSIISSYIIYSKKDIHAV